MFTFVRVKSGFNNILIPVDFTVNTEVAINKALALCDSPDITIHLFHVAKVNSFTIFSIYQHLANYSLNNSGFTMKAAGDKLKSLRDDILSLRADVEVVIWVTFDPSVETSIINWARKLKVDLIVIGKNSHHCWLPILNTVAPTRIATKSGITVLTAKPGALNNTIKTIVIPIGENFPSNKLCVIRNFTAKWSTHIKLVTFLRSDNDEKVIPSSLLYAYRELKNNPANNVSYELLKGPYRVKSILNYCNRIHADLVIVNPQTETKASWINTQISDLLPASSKTQILVVHPVS